MPAGPASDSPQSVSGTQRRYQRCGMVAQYHITVVNHEFVSSNEHECDDIVAAREYAVESTLDIASEQVKSGKPFFGAEVILREDGDEVARFVVCAGASMLKAPATQ